MTHGLLFETLLSGVEIALPWQTSAGFHSYLSGLLRLDLYPLHFKLVAVTVATPVGHVSLDVAQFTHCWFVVCEESAVLGLDVKNAPLRRSTSETSDEEAEWMESFEGLICNSPPAINAPLMPTPNDHINT